MEWFGVHLNAAASLIELHMKSIPHPMALLFIAQRYRPECVRIAAASVQHRQLFINVNFHSMKFDSHLIVLSYTGSRTFSYVSSHTNW